MLRVFVYLVIFTTLAYAKPLGYCPKSTADECRKSLSAALDVVTNCPLDRPRTKECAFILVETLSEADTRAPFYEGFYQKDFEIGDVQAYKTQIENLKGYSMHAWLVLHNLAKALILYYLDIKQLTDMQRNEIHNLIQPSFTVTEGQSFDIHNKTHISDFIRKQIEMAKAIQWAG